MAEVTIKINNKPYGIACDDGQEERVRGLSEYINARYMSVAGSGAASDVQNMVLTSIILADEIADMKDYIAQLEEQITNPTVGDNVQIQEVEVIKEVIKEVPAQGALSEEDVEQVADLVMNVTNRINHLSNKLAKAA